ncbi:MAG: protein translocase subunit SecF [Candidatus Marinamargulisbacteria bacterium]
MIEFIKKRRLWYLISTVVIGIGIVAMIQNFRAFNHIFNMGIDFTGGSTMTLRFDSAPQQYETRLREMFSSLGLKKLSIQTSGVGDILLKTQQVDVNVRNQLFNAIKKEFGEFEVLEVDVIGPSIGEQLRKTSFIILISVAVAILMYCSWRFEFIFGISSIIALLHDALIILAMTALLKVELSTAYIAALLTVLGYSINDTIVIFDRVREKMRMNDQEEFSKEVLNQAVNEMLPRSIHTSISTGIVVFSIFFFAGMSLKVFSTVLIVGLITGTYSSLFIASPLLLTITKLRGGQVAR